MITDSKLSLSHLGELQAATSQLSQTAKKLGSGSSSSSSSSSSSDDTASAQKVLMAKTLELQRTVAANQELVKQCFNSEFFIFDKREN